MVRLKKIWGRTDLRPAVQEKKNLCDSESLPVVQQQTHISEGRTPPLIGRGPDIPVRVCTFENVCAAAVRQREVSSRDARSVANLATLSLDLVFFQTPIANSDKSSHFLDKL